MSTPESSEQTPTAPAPPSAAHVIKFHPLDVVLALLRYKHWLLLSSVLCVAGAVVFVSFQPSMYAATTRLLPPKTKLNAAAMLSQTGSLAGSGLGAVLEGQRPVIDMYVAILQSRAAAEFIDNSFGLRQRWGGSPDHIYARLAQSTKVVPSPSGIISIEVSDTDPVWAAKLANGYASALQAITQELAVNEASKRRLFYEQQMNVALYQLTIAETALRKIQQETGVLKLDTQIEMAIRESSRLRAEIASKETELAAMKAFATESNPDYLRLKYEVEALRRQLAQWRQPAQTNADLSMQTSEGLLPEISMEYVKRYREVKNLELVYELFLKELQLTRIDQVKDATMIELLDRAVPPSTPSYPRKKRIVIIAGFVGLLLGVLLVLAYELLKVQLQYEENMRRMNLIGVEVKGYFSFRQKLKGFKWMRKK
jgi:uncharacterized protein involved in exopolysaccharide biosynthesis